jgi:hypothetical protein
MTAAWCCCSQNQQHAHERGSGHRSALWSACYLAQATVQRSRPSRLGALRVTVRLERFLCMSSAASWGEEALYERKVRPRGGTYHGITDRRFTMAGP